MADDVILSALQDGPKQYGELRKVMPLPMLDYQLNKLMREKKIAHVYDHRGVCRFTLPGEQPQDKPLPPSTYRPLPVKRTDRRWEPYKVVDGKIVNGRRQNDIEKPTCPQCKKRAWRRRFMYGGRLNILCFECGGKNGS